MPTIAIVGAGPGPGLVVARTFSARGFDVALISRNRDDLDGLVARLEGDGIASAAFPADVGAAQLGVDLHQERADDDIQAAHVAIGVVIGCDAPPGHPAATAEQIAPTYWDLDVTRDVAERVFTGWMAVRTQGEEPR